MTLSDRDIKKAIENGDLKIEPFEEENIQPASFDLRLGETFLKLDYNQGTEVVKLNEAPCYTEQKGKIVLLPGEFILGTTVEYIFLASNLTADLQGRSSMGRRGLFVQNAGWIDPGFSGNLTLQLFNATHLPIELIPGTRICQLIFDYTNSPCEHPYAGKYNQQKGASASKSYKDKEYSQNQ